MNASHHRVLITAEDGMRTGGVGSTVTAALQDLGVANLPVVRVLGTPDEFIAHAKPAQILAEAGLDATGIAAAARAALGALSHDDAVLL